MTDRPYMEALETQFTALRGAEKFVSNPRQHSDSQRKQVSAIIKQGARSLRHAATFAWTAECRQAVQHVAKNVPLTTTVNGADVLGPMWYWFGDDADHTFKIGAFSVQLCALLVTPLQDEVDGTRVLVMIPYARPAKNKAPMPIIWWKWAFGSPLSSVLTSLGRYLSEAPPTLAPPMPDEATNPQLVNLALDLTRFVAAADAWLRQRILTVTPEPVERHRRRQLAREFALETPLSDVKVIHLRRTEYEPHGSGEHRTVDWHCRWIVEGHWRHQACGTGLTERRLIYVWSYPKGPADKPLRVPTATVHLVDR